MKSGSLTRALQFLVLDELQTYRGRQGADVWLLVRRIRERCGNPNLLCIGTSATEVAGGTRMDRLNAIASVASKIFGIPLTAANVIGETLVRTIFTAVISDDAFKGTVAVEPQEEAIGADFSENPLAIWVESEFGLSEEEAGHLWRGQPITLAEGPRWLAERTGLRAKFCEDRLQAFSG